MAFDEIAWSEDLRNATASGRDAARQVRRKLENRGQPVAEMMACDDEGRDGTRLGGCVKTYIPQPIGPWGLVYLIARDTEGRFRLDHRFLSAGTVQQRRYLRSPRNWDFLRS